MFCSFGGLFLLAGSLCLAELLCRDELLLRVPIAVRISHSFRVVRRLERSRQSPGSIEPESLCVIRNEVRRLANATHFCRCALFTRNVTIASAESSRNYPLGYFLCDASCYGN